MPTGGVLSRGGKTGRRIVRDRDDRSKTDTQPRAEASSGRAEHRNGRGECGWRGLRSGSGTKSKRQGAGDDFRNFPGRVQPRMERTFGAITHSYKAAPHPRLSPFQSFGD